jgi:CheY-like chemotaxis protein
MKLILESIGYEVTVKNRGSDALEAFKVQPDEFDLVISDMTMPMMTGIELAKEMMKIRSDIPIIICTGFSELIDEEVAMKLGIRAFVMKPIVKKDIAKTIREILN